MTLPKLVVITEWSRPRLLETIERVIAASPPGAVAVQHRHPDASARRFVDEARALEAICSGHRAPLFINGRLDVAVLLGAHLHLPSTNVLAADARRFVRGWISAAVHSEAEAGEARGADFALVSPVFTAGSKPGDTRAPLGAEGFARLARALSCPAFALGGLTPDRSRALRPAGVAAISAILDAADPVAVTRAFLE